MKRSSITALVLLSALATPVFADQVCPSSLVVMNGTVVPPAGSWQVTDVELSQAAKKTALYPMSFDEANYGYDQLHKYNNQQISCGYKVQGDDDSYVEITTTNGGFTKPNPNPKNHWEKSYQNTENCGDPLGYASPEQCSWK